MRKFILFSALITVFASCSENYSNGERIGLITKFARSGLIYKSWEGELHVTQTGMNSTMKDFDFSIDDNHETDRLGQPVSTIAFLDSAAKFGWKVRLIYHQCYGENITRSRGDTDYFVDSVQVLSRDLSINQIVDSALSLSGQGSVSAPHTAGRVIDTIFVVIVPKEKVIR